MNTNTALLAELKREMKTELDAILQWWAKNMVDEVNGGFYGKIDAGNQLQDQADKGVVLNTRILWAFAAAANLTENKQYEMIAHRAFAYIVQFFYDKEDGGLFWMLNFQGQPTQTKKQIYAQAFGIYAFSEYYALTKKQKALDLAIALFQAIEQHSLDKVNNGYFEAYTRDWQPLDDLRLSEKDANEAKTMNSHLHILEAYTNLFRVHPTEEISTALQNLIECFLSQFIDPGTYHLHLFFDEQWQLKSPAISYGHDIECSWLLYEAAEVLGNEKIISKVKHVALKMAKAVLQNGIDESGGVYYEKTKAHLDREKHWWAQAEAIVGFFNAFQLEEDPIYLQTTYDIWNFTKTHIQDQQNGEWHWSLLANGCVNQKQDKAGPWKAPYHNGRMCMELLKRVGD